MYTRVGWGLFAAVLGGCSLPGQKADFTSVDPQERTLAALEAARTGDRSAVPNLIEQLESEDPAERMVAIRTLESLTGQTLGYDHAASEPQRTQAIVRWKEWARSTTGQPPADPASQSDSSNPPTRVDR